MDKYVAISRSNDQIMAVWANSLQEACEQVARQMNRGETSELYQQWKNEGQRFLVAPDPERTALEKRRKIEALKRAIRTLERRKLVASVSKS